MYQFSKSKSGLEKENNTGKSIKRTVAGFLAGINMMVPGVGTAASEKPAPEEIKSPAGVSDVLIGETEKGELEKLEEIEVNRRFSEFLNGEGEYSDKELRKIFYTLHSGASVDLGFLEAYGTQCLIQSVVLFNKNVEGNEFLAMGIKNKQGERKITVINWPTGKFFEVVPKIYIWKTIGSGSERFELCNKEEVSSFLSESFNRMYCFDFFYEDGDDNRPLFNGEQLTNLYNSIYLPKISVNREFLADIYVPMKKKDIGDVGRKMLDSLKNKRSKLLEIDSYQEFLEAINNESIIPVPFSIEYKEK